MTSYCGEPHPDDKELLCDRERPCFVFHESGEVSWQNTTKPTKSKKAALEAMKGIGTPSRAGEPDPKDPYGKKQPVEPRPAHDDGWEQGALAILKIFVEECGGVFTTADVWPFLPNPPSGDRRVMLHVRNRAVDSGWMEETGDFKRVKKAVTSDGVEFSMGSKPIPYFRPLLGKS